MKKRRALSCSAFHVNQWVAKVRSRLKGSSGRTRTYDLAVNSRPLYQLSYRGMLSPAHTQNAPLSDREGSVPLRLIQGCFGLF